MYVPNFFEKIYHPLSKIAKGQKLKSAKSHEIDNFL
jgi:hypothetical protein